ncbi:MAG: phenylalanine--tRNA ligase subunit alpha [Nitrospinae bacterium]|nr:phenylalanine--tRNA ligase subunit alpha [Nitrospinota bacterium]
MAAQTLIERLQGLKAQVASLPSPADERELEALRVKYLGKKGTVSLLSQEMASAPKDEKPVAGKLLQEVRGGLETMLEQARVRLTREKIQKEIEQEFFDISLPGSEPEFGARHPIAAVMDEIVDIFTGMGFQVEEGPEVESDYYNFEGLNFPAEHPARDMQDTFHLTNIERLLRTHTSPVQVRAMQKYGPPLSVIAPGKVYRCDADITHSPMFHQIEGFTIDKKITMGDLKGTLQTFIQRLYGPKTAIRLRPSFFPFVEPGAEVDVSCVICGGKGCRVCKHTGWLEILGAGMIHPNVMRASKIDPAQWSGFAFGMGIERIAMLKYGVDDIRLFFENDLRFLRQF